MTFHLSPWRLSASEHSYTSSGIDRDGDAERSNTKARNTAEDNVELFKRSVPRADSIEEKTFDARVQLKVETANVAMHLSSQLRAKLFKEFDYLLDVEGWDEEDKLPSVESYRRFLKWIIYAKDTSWTSLGIDDLGNMLVAWVGEGRMMTANFSDPVKWTKRVDSGGVPQISLGEFDLNYFAEKSLEFLS